MAIITNSSNVGERPIDLENDQTLIASVFNKAELFANNTGEFNMNTVNLLIVFLRSQLNEIRGELRSKIIVRLIRQLRNSAVLAKNLEKNTHEFNKKFSLFLEYGFQYYVDIYNEIPDKKPIFKGGLISRVGFLYRRFLSFFSFNRPSPTLLNSLREILANLDRPGSALVNNFVLPSPMEEVQASETEVIPQLPLSPCLPDNSQAADPIQVSIISGQGAIPEKL